MEVKPRQKKKNKNEGNPSGQIWLLPTLQLKLLIRQLVTTFLFLIKTSVSGLRQEDVCDF